MMNTEAQKVIERYEKRKNDEVVLKNAENHHFNYFSQLERELKYIKIIKSHFNTVEDLKVIEIGAGTGGNLFFFKKIGLNWDNIYANELLKDRVDVIKETFPSVKVFEGDASEIENLENSFDIVFQSTVFTSILDDNFKNKLASKMWRLLKPGGIILWYDFTFNNPNNKDVKGIKEEEIKLLFKDSSKISFSKTTLAPPIGRKVKNFYPFFNIFPFLRTHTVAVIEK